MKKNKLFKKEEIETFVTALICISIFFFGVSIGYGTAKDKAINCLEQSQTMLCFSKM
jgi:hypothetical protein